MKFYEVRNPYTGEHRWWTQRDKSGNCFEIKKLQQSNRFRLYVNDFVESDYETLIQAQEAAYKREGALR